MKLHKLLTVNGKAVELNTDDVRLGLFNPGRAAFTVNTRETLAGVVEFSIGYNPNSLTALFSGFIENSFPIDKKQQQLFCREFTAALNRMLPINLRNCSLPEVLKTASNITAIRFVHPVADYCKTKAPAFYSIGHGYHCMDSLARVYRVPQMIWQQQGDGSVFVGAWKDSYWAGKEIALPVEWQARSGIANAAKVPAVPSVRPGVKFTSGATITSVSFSDAHMEIEWDFNPWGTRWINKSSVS
jgi:hypothetical protein